VISAQELLERAGLDTGLAERWPDLMLVMVTELEATPVSLPPELAGVLVNARAYWQGDISRRADLEAARIACWAYFQQKNGNSVAIVDDEDRLIRASICVLDPEPGDLENASDRAEWLCDMLNRIDR
jgi:hypothetical protein